ncbi:DUF6083 domain-containing protein [Streptomyces sp. NPDC051567]|uniref:DUF6083 domain-containing protein n=1 Tax=Streptomyces sp. NPDC051567 TaxID=3365660 RepID=UPI0037BC2A7B
MNTCTDEQGRGDDTGPFLLANVLADALVTFGWDQRPQVHEGTPAVCHGCGRAAVWYPTVQHTWVLLEPGETACGPVPPGERWHVTGNGIAVRLLGSAPTPTDTCRTTHATVCPEPPR